jgi:hypothetical protein
MIACCPFCRVTVPCVRVLDQSIVELRDTDMICRYCNSALASGALICAQCGAPRPSPLPQSPPPRRRQIDFRVSWGEPAPDPLAHSGGGPLVTAQPPAPYAATASYVAPGPWRQQQYWLQPPRLRSFRLQAFIALALYFFGFVPGLIATIYWWNQARNLQVATGIAPRGKGCLTIMLVSAVIMMMVGAGIAGIF